MTLILYAVGCCQSNTRTETFGYLNHACEMTLSVFFTRENVCLRDKMNYRAGRSIRFRIHSQFRSAQECLRLRVAPRPHEASDFIGSMLVRISQTDCIARPWLFQIADAPMLEAPRERGDRER